MKNIFYIFNTLTILIYIYILLNLLKGKFPINVAKTTFIKKINKKNTFQKVVVLLILSILINILSCYLFEKEIILFMPLFIFQIAIINFIYRTTS